MPKTKKVISPQELTKAEFIEKYSDIKVKFSSYYKFTFTYTAKLDTGSISVATGGNSADIYRDTVQADDVHTVNELDPFHGVVYDAEGNKVYTFYDV